MQAVFVRTTKRDTYAKKEKKNGFVGTETKLVNTHTRTYTRWLAEG